MASYWGQQLHISIFGESHGRSVGVVIDGLPPGEIYDEDLIRTQMARRAPGRHDWSTARTEADVPEVQSGVFRQRTTGTPLAALITNRDTRSQDYEDLAALPRPGHADLTGLMRYDGANDPRGGGHFSGRLTAPLCYAGAVAIAILKRRGVSVHAHIASIAAVSDASLDSVAPDLTALAAAARRGFPVLDPDAGERMLAVIAAAKTDLDSVGGVVEVVATGFPPGIGDPMMGGLEPRIASLIYAVPAVKGLEFGAGFGATLRRGSENNDPPVLLTAGDGSRRIRLASNHGGGADGGISNGMPLICRVAIKPTPSIGKTQRTVNLESLQPEELVVRGRHDPCIVPRAVPVLEGAVAIALLDSWLASGRFVRSADLPAE
ncbi:MAG: chorismate synthase [Bacillota bacterium]|nr:chorismate synthase [Bacillota bacterium]